MQVPEMDTMSIPAPTTIPFRLTLRLPNSNSDLLLTPLTTPRPFLPFTLKFHLLPPLFMLSPPLSSLLTMFLAMFIDPGLDVSHQLLGPTRVGGVQVSGYGPQHQTCSLLGLLKDTVA